MDLLNIVESIHYLGSVLSNNAQKHVEARTKACRRAFFSLQGSGLYENAADAAAIAAIWNSALSPVLLFGDHCVSLRKHHIDLLDKTQAKLLKVALKLPYNCKTTPILNALDIKRVSAALEDSTLKLMNNVIFNSSLCRTFYINVLSNTILCKK